MEVGPFGSSESAKGKRQKEVMGQSSGGDSVILLVVGSMMGCLSPTLMSGESECNWGGSFSVIQEDDAELSDYNWLTIYLK